MFKSSYRIATVWGIPIKIHISLIALLAYFALQSGRSGGAIAIGFVMLLEVLIFFSIAMHELGHSFVAMRKGCRVREITLMFIGGAAQMERIPSRPRDELQMAVAGPVVSLCMGLTGFFSGQLVARAGLHFLGSALVWAGIANFFLAGFNLLPAFPMDGGRVLRALLTPKMGRLRATFVAARIGRVLAVVFGVLGFLSTPTRWVLVVIAFFVFSAAGNEYRMVEMEEAYRRQGFASWPPFDPEPQDEDEDSVLISPPPYRKGPGQKTDIRSSDDDRSYPDFPGR